MTTIYDFKARSIDGEEIDFDSFKDKILLIVNTASKCGFTPQYGELEKLYKQFSSQNFKIIAFPCNQFGNQEPGTTEEIAYFCKKNYGLSFPLMEKINVNGKNAHPLYKYLTEHAPGIIGTKSIKWNFTKFLVNRSGKIIKRYAPATNPLQLRKDIQHVI